jgi:signal transduction histidine kinase/CheY-like chemotaxis protein
MLNWKKKARGTRDHIASFSYVIIGFSLVSGIALGIISGFSYTKSNQVTQKENYFSKAKSAVTSFSEGSDVLTNSVWYFASTKNTSYMNQYWTEVETTRSRDHAVQILLRMNLSSTETGYVNMAKSYSDHLIYSETWAMRMICESMGLDVSKMPNRVAEYTLSSEDAALSAADKEAKANKFLFSYEYASLKYSITSTINEFDLKLTTRLTKEINDMVAVSSTLNIVSVSITFVMIVALVWMIVAYIIVDNRNRRALKEALVKAEAASSAKTYFTSRMSHEIRTPLNAVIGYMALAQQEKNDSGKANEYIAKSDKAAHSLLDIVNDVLDLSAIESGRMQLASSPFSAAELISSVSLVYYAQAKLKNVNFQNINIGIQDEIIEGDRIRTNQILTNLLSNACKFTPAGGLVVLTVLQDKTPDGNITMTYIVSDNGIGMSEEFQKRIFTPYEQESSAVAQKYGGTGLGLSIVKKLIELMGGTIECFSKKDHGTTFKAVIPYKRAPQNIQPSVDYSNCQCLVAENNRQYGSTICSYLSDLGMANKLVVEEKDLQEAIGDSVKQKKPFDFVICEWEKHQEVSAAFKASEPIGKSPIFIIDAYDTTIIKSEAEKEGITLFAPRPLFKSNLSSLFASILNKNGEDKATKTEMTLQGMQILLAEDNKMNAEIAQTILENQGAKIDRAEDGQQAIDIFSASKVGYYDVILMDIMMPNKNGYQATKEIRALSREDSLKVRIIAMTANAFVSDIQAAYDSGMNGFLSKPIDVKKLIDELQKSKKQS